MFHPQFPLNNFNIFPTFQGRLYMKGKIWIIIELQDSLGWKGPMKLAKPILQWFVYLLYILLLCLMQNVGLLWKSGSNSCTIRVNNMQAYHWSASLQEIGEYENKEDTHEHEPGFEGQLPLYLGCLGKFV